ncbi:ATP-dependent DNA helicase RecG [Xylocopilactobacillus apicola]|uniref:ATP-dependent DNA helicase RecG n=1 Tax=Xylocopilactobacillus apicola TaxID=2932184 RepID=A0AAU9D9K0_9LACO|nr:ATP-dependent DNA helicase RecG [Xylocopilactobacillus apicola]BDR58165.1 ATP-dependent DNA helicase RecG [Xylocopilactobacillus apicola]
MSENTIFAPVSVLPRVGEKKVEALNGLGIKKVIDLLYYFPYRYEDLSKQNIENLVDGDKAVLQGQVVTSPVLSRFGGKRNSLRFKLDVENLIINVVFFNQPYLRDKILIGQEIAIYGKWEQSNLSLVGSKIIDQAKTGQLEPIYSTTASIKQWSLRKLIKDTFTNYQKDLVNIVPEEIRLPLHLMSEAEMLKKIHFPVNYEEAQVARKSAVFEEFFLYLSRLRWLNKDEDQEGVEVNYDLNKLKKFIETLPFELTDSQKKAVNEICYDIKSPLAMNRLLQGDVGSGKTIVAALGIYAAATAKMQSALMVPTEVLAAQHYDNLKSLFKDTSLEIALLTSATPKAQRKNILERLKTGVIDLVIGTHALIQPDVEFKNLSLVIIDEQHRFGVNQRRALRVKGLMPNILSMTATPIPRTLAITIYGSIKISTIKEMPRGRLPIKTLWVKSPDDPLIDRAVQYELKNDHQVYVVTPLVAESEKIDLRNAEEIYDQYVKKYPEVEVALLHGKMKAEAKEQILTDFAAQKSRILISTTVIEVGVDVKAATLMIIYDANRFGLSQLHQLRGRVGRSSLQSYCVLVGNPTNDIAKKRLELMVKSNDGFVLAENDLKLRGAGEVFGSRQSGEINFKVGDPLEDQKALQLARSAVDQVFKSDPLLENEANGNLHQFLIETKDYDETID